MKKIIISGMLSLIVATSLSANSNIERNKLAKSPLGADYLSVENGGNKSAIDAYSDGVGLFISGTDNSKLDNSAMNKAVYEHGEEAKISGKNLKEVLEDKGINSDVEIIASAAVNSVIGESCDDGREDTINDIYVNTNGTCLGTELVAKSSVKCFGDPTGSEFLVNGVSYLVVDNNTIKNNTYRAETLCVSNVTNMADLFNPFFNPSAANFNQDISSWDVSNVTDMRRMFQESPFNQDISSWDVSNVTTMSAMFNKSPNFNQDISSWDVSKVTNMSTMFTQSPIFNQDISSWDVSNVTDMRRMFQESPFNQDISSWDVSNVTTMSAMFTQSPIFNQDISSWDVSNVTNMSSMFREATSFNQDISSWKTSKVTHMYRTFENATSFNQDISSWDVSRVISYSIFASGSPTNSNPSYLPNFQ